MTALAPAPTVEATGAAPARRAATGRRGRGWWRWPVLLVAAVYFLVPLVASVEFSLRDVHNTYSFASYRGIVDQPGSGAAFWLSIKLAAMAVGITLALMVPTVTYVHLKLPKLMRVIEIVTILPLVIPPVVLVVGVLQGFQGFPAFLTSSPTLLGFEYVVLALPFAFRSLDAGLRSVDLKTLVEASRSLGGRWWTELFRVVLPNLRSAVLGATLLTVALVMGELTMANLLLFNTFPVWAVQVGQSEAGVSVAVSVLSLVVIWILLLLISAFDRRRGATKGSRS